MPECDEPNDISAIPEFMQKLTIPSGYATIANDLKSDVSDFELPLDVSEGKTCGNVRIVFVLKDDSGSETITYGTKSVQIHIACVSNTNMGDVKLTTTYASSEIPVVEVGDSNPFGAGSEVSVEYGDCHAPKTIACMYCGFEDGNVGGDDETWNMWDTIEVSVNISQHIT